MVSKIANLTNMNFTIEYFHARVKAEIESWPDDLLAEFARMVELLMDLVLISGCRTQGHWAGVSLN